MKKEEARISKIKTKLVKEILKIKGAHLNGSAEKSLPNILNTRFDYIEGESLVMQLDMHGIACSTGSACSSTSLKPSHVLLATGLKPEQAHGSLRISLGRFTKQKDIDYFLKILPEIVTKLRKISPFK